MLIEVRLRFYGCKFWRVRRKNKLNQTKLFLKVPPPKPQETNHFLTSIKVTVACLTPNERRNWKVRRQEGRRVPNRARVSWYDRLDGGPKNQEHLSPKGVCATKIRLPRVGGRNTRPLKKQRPRASKQPTCNWGGLRSVGCKPMTSEWNDQFLLWLSFDRFHLNCEFAY